MIIYVEFINILREVSSHHEIHLVKFQSSASKQQKARLPFFEAAQWSTSFGSVLEMFLEQPSVAAWVVPPSFSCKMSFLSIFCNFLQGDTAYVNTALVKLSTYHPLPKSLGYTYIASLIRSKALLMLQGGMVSLGWSVKDDRNLEVFVGFLMGSPRILTLACVNDSGFLLGKTCLASQIQGLFYDRNFWEEKRFNCKRVKASKRLRDLQECILCLLHLLSQHVEGFGGPVSLLFAHAPTTQRLQVLGSGMSGPVQLATGQGRCLWMSVVKLHTEGAWNNS